MQLLSDAIASDVCRYEKVATVLPLTPVEETDDSRDLSTLLAEVRAQLRAPTVPLLSYLLLWHHIHYWHHCCWYTTCTN